jgi:hypothetical protein
LNEEKASHCWQMYRGASVRRFRPPGNSAWGGMLNSASRFLLTIVLMSAVVDESTVKNIISAAVNLHSQNAKSKRNEPNYLL